MLYCKIVFLAFLFLGVQSEEPHCSKYDFEEKVLEKLIRLEFQMERMKLEIGNSVKDVENKKTAVDAALKNVDQQLEDYGNNIEMLEALHTKMSNTIIAKQHELEKDINEKNAKLENKTLETLQAKIQQLQALKVENLKVPDKDTTDDKKPKTPKPKVTTKAPRKPTVKPDTKTVKPTEPVTEPFTEPPKITTPVRTRRPTTRKPTTPETTISTITEFPLFFSTPYQIPLSEATKADIVIAVHLTPRASPFDFGAVKQFLKSLIENANVENEDVQIGLMFYAADPEVIFHINQYQNIGNMKREIDGLNPQRMRSYRTDASGALALGRQMLSSYFNGRPDVPSALIFVTDEPSNENVNLLEEAKQRVVAEGINIYAIWVGMNDKEELETLATAPENVMMVKTYVQLKDAAADLQDKILALSKKETTTLKATTTPTTTTQKVMTTSERFITLAPVISDEAVTPTVAFKARLNSDSAAPVGQPFVFPIVLFNEGDAYSSSTGKFTSTTSGTYLFTVVFCVYNSKSLAIGIMVDGSKYTVATFYGDGNNGCSTADTVAVLTTGQTVWVEALYSNSGTIIDQDGYRWNAFSGILIHN